jgi:hypothetical protein
MQVCDYRRHGQGQQHHPRCVASACARLALASKPTLVLSWQASKRSHALTNEAVLVTDNCANTACVFDDMVGGFETVRCKKLQVQAKGFVPTVQIDNTEAIQLFASKQAEEKGMAVIQSMSTEINLTILPPDEDEETEPTELPLPSQFVTKFTDGKWVTEPNEHLA